ncbi:hypothetical protein NX794_30725 [Streptomyces sp. LP11]|uniref:Uncharacterized protein n=1 Tax=Streptomyces pyxinicus TaxID=2970331 RepID=A0ABT2BAL0_9ACTN|nr:hypothetical protein [Streptomyces sp. LP11]MCS0605546.1 hypothetical protein [Streptomyces sp. LP11]
MAVHESRNSPRNDREVVTRLLPVWLEEMERHDPGAAERAREGWESGALSEDAAQDLATWVTARVTDTGFNDEEGPRVDGPARITPADKESLHRWLAAHGHHI